MLLFLVEIVCAFLDNSLMIDSDERILCFSTGSMFVNGVPVVLLNSNIGFKYFSGVSIGAEY